MPLLQRLFNTNPTARPDRPLSALLSAATLNGGRTDAGVSVSEEISLQIAAVWRAVNLIAGTNASLPLKVFSEDSRERVRVSVLDSPHPEMTTYEFWEVVWFCLLLWGNAYLQKIRDANGSVSELWIVHPSLVQVGRVKASSDFPGGKVFAVTDDQGKEHVLTSRDILHIPGPGYDGICGVSPIRLARQGLGLSLAAEQYGARLFGSGSLMSGVLQTEQRLDQPKADQLKASWQAKVSGLGNAHQVAILDSGAKFQPVSIPPEDAQFLESRRFQVAEVARLFGIPPHMLFDLERTTSWGTGIETQGIGFVVYTLRPWLTRVEQRVTKELLDDGQYAEFTVEGLLRGDSKTRAEFYTAMVGIRAMSANEVRSRENLEPYDGGDVFANPAIDVLPEESAGQSLPEEIVRSVMGRLSWQKSLEEVDETALIEGLNGHGRLVLNEIQTARAAGASITELRTRLKALAA